MRSSAPFVETTSTHHCGDRRIYQHHHCRRGGGAMRLHGSGYPPVHDTSAIDAPSRPDGVSRPTLTRYTHPTGTTTHGMNKRTHAHRTIHNNHYRTRCLTIKASSSTPDAIMHCVRLHGSVCQPSPGSRVTDERHPGDHRPPPTSMPYIPPAPTKEQHIISSLH